MKTDQISRTHDQYWDRHYENQMQTDFKILNSAPNISQSKIRELGHKASKGVAA